MKTKKKEEESWDVSFIKKARSHNLGQRNCWSYLEKIVFVMKMGGKSKFEG